MPPTSTHAQVKNYGLALLDIELPTYMGCCLLGSCIGVPAQALLGKHLGGVYLGVTAEGDMSEMGWQMALGTCVGLGSLVLVMKVMVPALLNKDLEDGNDSKATEANKDK